MYELFDFVHKKVLKCLLLSRTCNFTSVFMTASQIKLRVFIFRDFLGVKTRDIFKPVRETRCTDCNVFQTCMSYKINHISKRSAPPKKINSHLLNSLKGRTDIAGNVNFADPLTHTIFQPSYSIVY